MAAVKIVELDDSNTCKICDNALAKYSCPKCNIIYCSLNCYQSNSHLECSENFYKDNILEELNIDKNSAESKTKMLEILKRTHEGNQIVFSDNEDTFDEYSGFDIEDLLNLDTGYTEEPLDSDDDEEVLDIGDRLAGIDLDDAEQVWSKLTEDEKQEFVSFLKSDNVTDLIATWQPWWLYYDNKKVEEVEPNVDYKQKCPDICNIKAFSVLTSKVPDDCLKYSVINILAAYAFTTRYFNGDYFDFAQEAVSCIGTISLSLKVGQIFTDFETAVKSVEQQCIHSDWITSDAENMSRMKEDIEKILRGPNKSEPKFYILCALSDIHNLLTLSLVPTKSEEPSGGFSKMFPNDHFPTVKWEEPQQLKNYIKKIDYFLSYTKDHFQP